MTLYESLWQDKEKLKDFGPLGWLASGGQRWNRKRDTLCIGRITVDCMLQEAAKLDVVRATHGD